MEIRAVSLLTYGAQPPPSNCREIYFGYSEFDRSRDLSTCQDLPVLYPPKVISTLALKLFRREPAITRFDQLFTPYHKSSEDVVRSTGSVLHPSFDGLQPAHGKLTWLRVLCILLLFALLTLGFPMTPLFQRAQSAVCINSLAHSSIGTPQLRRSGASTPCKHTVSGLFHRPNRAAFHLSLTVLVHYRSLRVFSLSGQFRQIPPGHSCPGVLKNNNKRDKLFSFKGLSPSMVLLSNNFN